MGLMPQLARPERHRRLEATCLFSPAGGGGGEVGELLEEGQLMASCHIHSCVLLHVLPKVFRSGWIAERIFRCLKSTSSIASAAKDTFSILGNAVNSVTSELTRRTSADQRDEAVANNSCR